LPGLVSNRIRGFLAFALIVVVPPALWTLILERDHSAHWLGPVSALATLVGCLLPGILGISLLRIGRAAKLVILPIYAILMAGSLFFWGFMFVCGRFGDCL
jgi:hypothetical protein